MAVTRADVAKRAGVSPSVVSYVLHPGMRPVAAETEARVLRAIDELGYRPNAIAQSLRRGPTKTLGLLLPDHTNPFFDEFARAVEDRAVELCYLLFVGSSGDDPEREASYLRNFVDRQVDGLIVVLSRPHAASDAWADDIPVVAVDRVPQDANFSTIVTRSEQCARQALEHLAGLGHRTIGLIAGPRGLSIADARADMWTQAAAHTPFGIEIAPIVPAAFSRQGGYDAARRLLAEPITALLTSSDSQALGALAALYDARLSVPEDVSIISFDGTRAAEFSVPSLTSISQPIGLMGALAIDRLVERIKDSSGPVHHDEVHPEFVVRSSTGPMRPRDI